MKNAIFSLSATRSLTLLLTLLLATTGLYAQEITCQVRVNNTAQTKNVDPRVYKSMESAIKDLIDARRWTDDVFKIEERINMSISITIKEEVSPTSFKADISVQGSRPIYGSNYDSPLITFVDKDAEFDFQENTPLDFSEPAPASALSALCGLYAYTVIGMDYDSFSLLGGQAYFQKAQALISSFSGSGGKGWKPAANDRQRTRYWIIESLTNPRSTPLRKAYYDYYLNGLDKMADKTAEAQTAMADAIERIGKVSRDLPASMVIQLFIDTKANEIVQVFTGTVGPNRVKVAETMTIVDGANATRYSPLLR
jgi:Domain of unknown function (DUF4835)